MSNGTGGVAPGRAAGRKLPLAAAIAIVVVLLEIAILRLVGDRSALVVLSGSASLRDRVADVARRGRGVLSIDWASPSMRRDRLLISRRVGTPSRCMT